MNISIEIIGHLTYVLLAISYWASDIFWLRLITIPACLCGILFGLCYPEGPIWVVVGWNILFLVINVFQMVKIWQSGNAELCTHSRRLFAIFKSLAPFHVRQMIRVGQLETIAKDVGAMQTLIHEGTHSERVYVLLEGRGEVVKNGELISICNAGAILGDISFVAGSQSTATVRVDSGATLMSWSHDSLKKLMHEYPDLRSALMQYFASEISSKLIRKESGAWTEVVA